MEFILRVNHRNNLVKQIFSNNFLLARNIKFTFSENWIHGSK